MTRHADAIAQLRTISADAGRYPVRSERLVDFSPKGSNPGGLRARYYVPSDATVMPLVVVLHGCTQNADTYDHGAGWSELAEKHGFAVLLPEQQRVNNANLCFNWFVPHDARRGSGEALSIRQMVATIVEQHAIDPGRVFVTGLSAGGAMASVMLATYPEVFAAGAVIAGLPYGAADTLPQALERMRGKGHISADRYASLVRSASEYNGPWPSVSIWHGDADVIVSPVNAEAMLGQWQSLHEIQAAPDRCEALDGAIRRQWRDRTGRVCLEDYRIAGFGHGTPLSTVGSKACGSPGAHMLDAGISSTWHIAASWGLLNNEVPDDVARQGAVADRPRGSERAQMPTQSSVSIDIQATIEAALRSAGLMR